LLDHSNEPSFNKVSSGSCVAMTTVNDLKNSLFSLNRHSVVLAFRHQLSQALKRGSLNIFQMYMEKENTIMVIPHGTGPLVLKKTIII